MITRLISPIKLTRHHFSNIPIAITGISLGFITLGNLWGDLGSLWLKDFANIFAATAVILMLLKISLHPKKCYDEMQHHMTGSFYPTIGMTLMVFSNFVASSINITAGQWVWWIGILIFVILSFLFIIAQIKSFSWHNVLPSWFVPLVGIGVAAVSSGGVQMTDFASNFFYIAFSIYLVTLIGLIYRIITHGSIPDDKKLTLAIIAAPASVCLAGYMATAKVPSAIILAILVPLALVSTFYVYTLIPKFLRIPFHPGLAPLTFPLAVGTVAVQRFANYLATMGSGFASVFQQLFYMELFVATLVIGYIVYKLLFLLSNKLLKNNKELITH